MRAVRWLGAFRKEGSLHSSLKWELQDNSREVAAEVLIDNQSHIHACVGLEVSPKAVRKVFCGDVWSENTRGGNSLRMTRSPNNWSGHTEAFCKPTFTAIVVKGKVSKKVFRIVAWWSKQTGLPVQRIRG